MAVTQVTNTIVHEVLRGSDNYQIWCKSIETHLVDQDLWNIIDGSLEFQSGDDRENFKIWHQNNTKVLQIISSACEPDISRQVLEYESAKDAWDALQGDFKNLESPMGPVINSDAVDNPLYARLLKAVLHDNWDAIKVILDDNRELKTAQISPQGKTVLHLAVAEGHLDLVKELLMWEHMLEQDLEAEDTDGCTALAIAAQGGYREIAKLLISRNGRLAELKTKSGALPVVLASTTVHTDLIRFLYNHTPPGCFHPEMDNGRFSNGAALVANCIIANLYDIHVPIEPACASREIHINIQVNERSQSNWANTVIQAIDKVLFKSIRRIKERKTKHSQTLKLLDILYREISQLNQRELLKSGMSEALFLAIENGTTEFVLAAVENYPHLLSTYDKHGRHAFQVAVLQRQEEIFNLLYCLGPRKYAFASWRDKYGNYMVHLAARLTPSRLRRRSGAALQFQSELQWFKEVERITKPNIKEYKTTNSKTPREIFDLEHEKLMEQGEKWMKDMASSSMIGATLIATVMFAAAFTVPGGFDQNLGFPVFLGDSSYMVSPFMLFIISDALSFFASATTVIIYLILLTSRYSEEDFLESLPRKLIIGLMALFISITTMMIAFGASLYMVLYDQMKWVIYPIVFLCSIPVILFGIYQIPLLVEIFYQTYGRNFNSKGIPW